MKRCIGGKAEGGSVPTAESVPDVLSPEATPVEEAPAQVEKAIRVEFDLI
jgi:hypothetical protein